MSDWVDVGSSDWEDISPQPKKPTTNWKEDIAINFANVGNTVDTAASMIGGGLSRLVSPEFSDHYIVTGKQNIVTGKQIGRAHV